MKRRIFAMLLTLAMCLPMLLLGAYAEGGAAAEPIAVTLTTEALPEARLCTPLGLRYVTALSRADYASLTADGDVSEIRIGTLIAPAETVARVGALTKAALAGEVYLDVPATLDAWYKTDDENLYFAGSIVNIKEQNLNLALVGTGYMEITYTDGRAMTVYATEDGALMPTTMAMAAQVSLRNKEINDDERYYMNEFAKKFDGDAAFLYAQDLADLNVLAIGDQSVAGEDSWISLLAERYAWSMTNLGIDGATVSYDPDRESPNASLYQRLMYDESYAFDGEAREVDLVVLSAGANDYSAAISASVGGIGSKETTFLGALSGMVDHLLDRYPKAMIVLVAPWASVDEDRAADNVTNSRYFSMLKSLYTNNYADVRRICLIEANDPKLSGIDLRDEAFKAQYATDQYHLNAAGMEKAAEGILPHLWQIAVDAFRTPLTKLEQMQRELEGLNVLALGDSLFSGSGATTGEKVWLNSLGVDCGWNLTNLGIGGSTISYDPDRTATNKSIYRMLINDENYKFGSRSNKAFFNTGSTNKDKKAVDVIFLEAGSNDYGSKVQAPLGTVDSTDPATFLGAWRFVTEELLRQYPNAIVIFITAWENHNQTRDDGAIAEEYTSSVVTLYDEVYAENDRVYLIDAGDPAVSGVNMRDDYFKNKYAYDIFHLNDEGMALMAKNMFPLVFDVIKNQAGIR